MDVPTGTDPEDKPSAYKTSKQVQAWFLGRSRDLWKKKYADLKVESSPGKGTRVTIIFTRRASAPQVAG